MMNLLSKTFPQGNFLQKKRRISNEKLPALIEIRKQENVHLIKSFLNFLIMSIYPHFFTAVRKF